MNFIMAFIVGGLICVIGQLLMDICKFLPVHITVLFVCLGALLEFFGLYDHLIEIGHAGALVPISSFGHSLADSAIEATKTKGYLGVFSGIFESTAAGISAAIIFAFFASLIFKPKN